MKLFEDADQRPLPPYRRTQIRSISESFDNWNESDEDTKPEPPPVTPKPIVSILKKSSFVAPTIDSPTDLQRLDKIVQIKQKQGVLYHLRLFGKQIVKLFDFGLLRDPIYVNMMLGMAIAIFAEINFSVLTPFILSDMGYATPDIAVFMSAIAITDIVFRFATPFVGELLRQPPRLMYMYSLVILMVSRAALLCTTSLTGIIVVGVFLGMGKGIRTVNLNLVIPNYIPLERLASASGIQMVTNGLLILSLGPCIGK
jgi:Major Facilitator Superfamily